MYYHGNHGSHESLGWYEFVLTSLNLGLDSRITTFISSELAIVSIEMLEVYIIIYYILTEKKFSPNRPISP